MNTSCHCSTYSRELIIGSLEGGEWVGRRKFIKFSERNVFARGENFSANHTKNATTTTWADFRFFSRDIFSPTRAAMGVYLEQLRAKCYMNIKASAREQIFMLPATSHNACNNCSITQFLEFQWEVEEFHPNRSQNKNTLSHCTFGASIDFLAIFKPCWPRSNVKLIFNWYYL